MGKKSRAKRDRREQADFAAALTACEGTWLERPPSAEEMTRISIAQKTLEQHRAEAAALSKDEEALHRFSLEIFRDPRFTALHFDDWLIESILDQHGEPPIVEDESDPSFSNYLRTAIDSIASSRVRRTMSAQVRRFIPQYIEAGQIREALAIDYNAYMTVMSNAVTPLLVQMTVGGLSRWYDEHEEEGEVVGEEQAE
jgi:hypothetical protein